MKLIHLILIIGFFFISACSKEESEGEVKQAGSIKSDEQDLFQKYNAQFSPNTIKKQVFMIVGPRLLSGSNSSSGTSILYSRGTGFQIDGNGLGVTNYHVMEFCIDALSRNGKSAITSIESDITEKKAQVLDNAILNKPEICDGFYAIDEDFIKSYVSSISARGQQMIDASQDLYIGKDQLESGQYGTAYKIELVSNFPKSYSSVAPDEPSEVSFFTEFNHHFDAVIIRLQGSQISPSWNIKSEVNPEKGANYFMAGFPKAKYKNSREIQSEETSDFHVTDLSFTFGQLGVEDLHNYYGNFISKEESAWDNGWTSMGKDEIIDSNVGNSGSPLFSNEGTPTLVALNFGRLNVNERNSVKNAETHFVSFNRIIRHYFKETPSGVDFSSLLRDNQNISREDQITMGWDIDPDLP